MIMYFRYRNGTTTVVDLAGMYDHDHAFLLGGGPALKDAAPVLAKSRVITMAMNNAGVHLQPTLWVGADGAGYYSASITQDPAIMKFMRIMKRDTKTPTGIVAKDLPNIMFMSDDDKMDYRAFFQRGRTVVFWKNVFVLALQILYRMGIQRVYTVGCGFNAGAYAHKSHLTDAHWKYNQNTYDAALGQVKNLLPFAKKAGFDIVSCDEMSKLHGIGVPYMTLDKAIRAAEMVIPPHNTVDVLHPLDDQKRNEPLQEEVKDDGLEFKNVDLPPKWGDHYTMGLEHRKAILRSLPVGGSLLEYGSGNSTYWYQMNLGGGEFVAAVEHDASWAKKTGALLYEFDAGKPGTPEAEELRMGSLEYAEKPGECKTQFDVIIVDGVVRNLCLMLARKFLKPNGIVFLHDSERSWYASGRAGYEVAKEYPACEDYPGREMVALKPKG